jgi:hypothetical protein
MSAEDESKWISKRYTLRYIPHRYQATVACIVSAFLYFRLLSILFEPYTGNSGACGSLIRPTFDGNENTNVGWIWDAGMTLFEPNSDLWCQKHYLGLWWNVIGVFIGLGICGFVLRRAMKREDAQKPV